MLHLQENSARRAFVFCRDLLRKKNKKHVRIFWEGTSASWALVGTSSDWHSGIGIHRPEIIGFSFRIILAYVILLCNTIANNIWLTLIKNNIIYSKLCQNICNTFHLHASCVNCVGVVLVKLLTECIIQDDLERFPIKICCHFVVRFDCLTISPVTRFFRLFENVAGNDLASEDLHQSKPNQRITSTGSIYTTRQYKTCMLETSRIGPFGLTLPELPPLPQGNLKAALVFLSFLSKNMQEHGLWFTAGVQ